LRKLIEKSGVGAFADNFLTVWRAIMPVVQRLAAIERAWFEARPLPA
jgi:hypothetical protein